MFAGLGSGRAGGLQVTSYKGWEMEKLDQKGGKKASLEALYVPGLGGRFR